VNFTRRSFNKQALAFLSSLTCMSHPGSATEQLPQSSQSILKKPVSLILDTDIGDDLDDTWALMQLLRSPGIDVKLITTDFGNTRYRSRLLAKLLQYLGHTHIPIGIGLDPTDKPGNQSDWLGEYNLDEYPGEVHEDGVQNEGNRFF